MFINVPSCPPAYLDSDRIRGVYPTEQEDGGFAAITLIGPNPFTVPNIDQEGGEGYAYISGLAKQLNDLKEQV